MPFKHVVQLMTLQGMMGQLCGRPSTVYFGQSGVHLPNVAVSKYLLTPRGHLLIEALDRLLIEPHSKTGRSKTAAATREQFITSSERFLLTRSVAACSPSSSPFETEPARPMLRSGSAAQFWLRIDDRDPPRTGGNVAGHRVQ
jgi:hypothetical protein